MRLHTTPVTLLRSLRPCRLLEANVRKAFVAAPGCVLLGADYRAIELRMMAHFRWAIAAAAAAWAASVLAAARPHRHAADHVLWLLLRRRPLTSFCSQDEKLLATFQDGQHDPFRLLAAKWLGKELGQVGCGAAHFPASSGVYWTSPISHVAPPASACRRFRRRIGS